MKGEFIMKKIISILLSFILIFSVISISITTYAEEIIEEKAINNFINGIVELSREYDAEKDFVPVDEENEATATLFFSNGETTQQETDSLDFQTARLIVRADKAFDTCGAIEHIKGFKDFHILQYKNTEDAEKAYNTLTEDSKIKSVNTDNIVSVDRKSETSDSNSENNNDFEETPEHLSTFSLERTQSKRLQDYIEETQPEMNEVVVGIIDTGVDYNHEFLQGRIVRSHFNATPEGSPDDEMDSSNLELCHGTAVSSVVVDNSPDNVKVSVYKVLDEEDSVPNTVIIAGILQAVSDEVDVINMSLGFNDVSGMAKEAQLLAYENNIPVITAVGNTGGLIVGDATNYLEENIIVAATNINNSSVDWNTFSSQTDIAAPGEWIEVALYGNNYDMWDGTSFSSPCVAALAAIMKSFNKDISVSEFENRMKDTSLKIYDYRGYSSKVKGNCMVQFANAFDLPKLKAPEINLSTGLYEGEQICTITCDDPNATILYTTNNTYPGYGNGDLKTYTEPLVLKEYTHLRAVAYYEDTGYYSGETTAKIRIGYLGNEEDFEIDEEGVITKYKGTIDDLIIPEYINGIQVKDISKNSINTMGIHFPDSITVLNGNKFYENEKLRFASGDCIITIGNSVFSDAYALEEVDFPNLEEIGTNAFYETYRLVYMDAPKVKSIGGTAFKLSGINAFIGNEVTTIGNGAFQYASYLETVYLPKVEKTKAVRDSLFYMSPIAFCYMPNYRIIGAQAFKETNIEVADFPLAEKISSSSFQECYCLKYVNLPNIKEIPSSAFETWGAVTETREYYFDNVVTIGTNAFDSEVVSRIEFSNLETAYSLPKTQSYYTVVDYCIMTMPSTFKECTIDTTEMDYKVYGTKGTYAEEWANENGHIFIEISQETAILEDLPEEYYGLGEILSPDVIGFNKTYQWYSNTEPNNTTGTPIEGATNKDFNPADYPEARYYYCVITSTDKGYDPIEIRTGVTENKTIHIHTEEEIPAVAPTCTETGLSAGAKCSECGEIITAQQELPALGHNYEAVITAPTCTEQGYTTYTCECGDSYVADITNSIGHTPATAVDENYVAPTCTENGSKDVVIYCSVCNEEISRETETIEATDHADNDGDGYCDADNELLDPSVECNHACHKSNIVGFIWKIINFFNKLFGLNKLCECGVAHY